ncbi:hypothetical protein [Aporhodopirellula aestuarii]|uniref:Transmembrane protein n=1 Tax=Aporhodopirellula aestuarii TaxID=2950107 RepID=A0ABT0UF50_9BACT|nr:hypothetical protein [Aporhodopirellula aestuarii]MCM2374816.1 hypothetical protein [Aporhodopirellula aestuarii]
MRPLIWKELRENVRWIPIGLFVITAICWMVHPTRVGNNALLATELVTHFAIVTPFLAFALGVVQSYRDLQPAAGAYLNHRSVTSSDVFFSKTIAGFSLYAVAILLPVLGLAMWVGYQGLWWTPMRAAQVVPAMVFAFIAFALHPAAMLMMARGASWWGTRLFPIVPAGAVQVVFFGYLHNGGLAVAGWCLLAALPTLAWMMLVANQGWRELSSDPSAETSNPRLSRRWLLPTYMLVGTTLCHVAGVIGAIGVFEDLTRSRVYVPVPFATLAVADDSGELWMTTKIQQYDATIGNYTNQVLGGERVENGGKIDAQADDAIGKEFRDFSSLWPLEATYWSGDGFFTQPSNALGSSILYAYDSRGYLLGYQQFPQSRWVQTIAADGVYAAGDFSGRPFQQDPLGNGWRLFSTLVNEGYLGPLVTSKGVMVIEQDPVGLRTLLEQDIEMGAVIPTPAGKAPRLILGIGNQLHEYRLIDETGSEDWYVEPDLNSNLQARQTSKSLKLNVEWVRTFDVPESLTHLEMHSVAWAPEELLIWQNTRRWDDVDVLKLRPNVPAKLLKFSVQPESVPAPHEDKFSMTMVACGFLPGAFYLLFLAISAWMVLTGHPSAGTPFPEIAANPISASTALISFVFVMALAFWLVRRVAYRRGLSSRQTRLWMWAVPAVTLAAPLSMVAMYRLVHREPCPSCGQPRRVDLIRCEHCEADWVQPETEGIEIVDRVA